MGSYVCKEERKGKKSLQILDTGARGSNLVFLSLVSFPFEANKAAIVIWSCIAVNKDLCFPSEAKAFSNFHCFSVLDQQLLLWFIYGL